MNLKHTFKIRPGQTGQVYEKIEVVKNPADLTG